MDIRQNLFNLKLKNTTLLYLGSVFFVLGIILVLVNGEEQLANISGIDDRMGGSLLVFILASIVIAPILEECAFRLPLLQKKWHLMVSLLALVGVVLTFTSSVLTFSIVALYAFVLLFKLFYSSQISHTLVLFCSVLVFAVIHYPNSKELLAAFLGGFVFFQLGLACITSFVVIKVNLFGAISVHFLYNSIIVGLLLFFTSRETFSDVPPVVEYNGHIFKFEPKNIINIGGGIQLSSTKKELSCKNCLPNNLLRYNDILDGKKEIIYNNKFPFIKFDISVTAINGDTINHEISQKGIEKYLIYSVETSN